MVFIGGKMYLSKVGDIVINSKELCEKLSIHINTLYRYIEKGMPHIKLDKNYLFNYEEVLNWLKERSK